MKLTLNYFLFISLILSSTTYGQQSVQYSQFVLNRYALNPAFGGMESSLSLTTGIRSQWSQFESSPKTQFVNASLPLYGLQGSGGISIVNDQLGALEKTSVDVSYNYVYEFPEVLISFGIKAGAQQLRIDGSQLRTPDGLYFDNSIDHRDPILGTSLNSEPGLNWGLGVAIITNDLELGVALDQFPSVENKLLTAYLPKSQYLIYGSYHYWLQDIIRISPAFLVKSDGIQTQIDLGSMAYYGDFIGGVFVRGINSGSLDAINLIAGAKLSDKLRLSYSFDIGLSALRKFHEGTHEFILNYNLNKKIKTGELPKIIYNPRFN